MNFIRFTDFIFVKLNKKDDNFLLSNGIRKLFGRDDWLGPLAMINQNQPAQEQHLSQTNW